MDISLLLNYLHNLREKTKVKNRVREGFSKQYGFLHIPKTGGTSIVGLGNNLVKMGYSFPVYFEHSWNIEKIHSAYPKMKISLALRDPLERMISGFNSRLRQGRPRYKAVWTPKEAAAMAILPSSKHLLDAMLSEDDYSVSAVAYAFENILHLKWNYCYYFKNADFVRKHKSILGIVGHMDHFENFAIDLACLCNAPEDLARALYQKEHCSVITSSILDLYTDEEIGKLRERLSEEYSIYDELSKLVTCENSTKRL
jgi:hypothetical protein